jgi:hypothetical protein
MEYVQILGKFLFSFFILLVFFYYFLALINITVYMQNTPESITKLRFYVPDI